MSLKDLHPKAYGLTEFQRLTLVKVARTGLYYEALLASRFGITGKDVQEICAADGYVCNRVDNEGKHIDGGEIP